MTGYGDKDPLDAWDDGDPLPVRLWLLARLLDDVGDDARRAILRRLAGKVATDLARFADG